MANREMARLEAIFHLLLQGTPETLAARRKAALAILTDLCDAASIDAAFATIAERWGGTVNTLVNAAGPVEVGHPGTVDHLGDGGDEGIGEMSLKPLAHSLSVDHIPEIPFHALGIVGPVGMEGDKGPEDPV